ncbi:MAG: hypothetical protein JOZ57_13115, partial [Abitibacteriaceae bacterium]|nr:hypothetical protein [Abditibacteriaceae bacterium]
MNQQISPSTLGHFLTTPFGALLPATPSPLATAQIAQQLRAALMNLHPLTGPDFSALHSGPVAMPIELNDVRECAPNVVVLPAPPWSAAEPRLWVRPEVGERLRRAAHALPSNLKIGFWEGFRPLVTQQALWNIGLVLLPILQPGLRRDELEWVLESCVARPNATAEHSTGYALDIAVLDESHQVLDPRDARGQLAHR